MKQELIRIASLIGDDAVIRLGEKRVALFGVGGVGSYAFEALVRSGVGGIDIFDNDTVTESNLNRQIIALQSTIGALKTETAALRAGDINPDVKIRCHNVFYSPETADRIDLTGYDYIIDAIDTVSAKLELICRAVSAGIPIISVMGTGNRLDPSKLCVADIYKTSGCPLARVMRYELRRRGIKGLKVVYSTEIARKPEDKGEYRVTGRVSPASAAFVPGAAGLIAASEAVRALTGLE